MGICCCKRCGKTHEAVNQTLCMSCIEREESEFTKIKEYLIDHPYSTVLEVAMKLDVPVKHIKYYLRECRLEIVERGSQKNILLTCEKCGIGISSGHYCTACESAAAHNFKGTAVIPYNGSIPGKSHQKKPAPETTVTYYQKSKAYA